MKTIILIGFLGLSFVSCKKCEWYSVAVPKPTPEDVRICAPAHYPNQCYMELGYRIVSSCDVEDKQ